MTHYSIAQNQPEAARQWTKFELTFQSDADYENPLYDIKTFYAAFTSPSGSIKKVNGFWNGGREWKIRFMPDEAGIWHYKTYCSDHNNPGLLRHEGTFHAEKNLSKPAIYQHGRVIHRKGDYHLTHADGTPFFWTACTAWNGTLKSTEKEWKVYLKHRAEHHFSVIQFVATQWRGCETDSRLQVAFTGKRKIRLNPAFFQHLDRKIDKINAYGLVAAPVLLWALPYGQGKELSPGYYLPRREAVLLAKYMVARYGAHHIIWILGGDGLFVSIYERRWKTIGRKVFENKHPAPVVLHPMGKSWIGEAYADEEWLDIIGYQSGHHTDKATIEFITKGPAAQKWQKLLPKPMINMEPCYEEIHDKITDDDVRKASYHSLFAAPVAGISYGANGIWPWIRQGERIQNHGSLGYNKPGNWQKSLELPGSRQISYLAQFIAQFAWWKLKPDPDLLAEQPGNDSFEYFISLVRSDDYRLMLAYVPEGSTVKIYNPNHLSYRGKWFNPKENTYYTAREIKSIEHNILEIPPPMQIDLILILEGG